MILLWLLAIVSLALADFSDDHHVMDYHIIKFSAEWSEPCRRIAADYRTLISQSVYANIIFSEIDVGEEEDAIVKYSIEAMPTFVLLKDDVEIGRVIGANLPGVRTMLDSTRDPSVRPSSHTVIIRDAKYPLENYICATGGNAPQFTFDALSAGWRGPISQWNFNGFRDVAEIEIISAMPIRVIYDRGLIFHETWRYDNAGRQSKVEYRNLIVSACDGRTACNITAHGHVRLLFDNPVYFRAEIIHAPRQHGTADTLILICISVGICWSIVSVIRDLVSRLGITTSEEETDDQLNSEQPESDSDDGFITDDRNTDYKPRVEKIIRSLDAVIKREG